MKAISLLTDESIFRFVCWSSWNKLIFNIFVKVYPIKLGSPQE